MISLQAWACIFIKKRLQHKSFSVKFPKNLLLQNTSGGRFWTNQWDLCGSSGKLIFFSFSISLHWLSNIKLNLLTKSSFDILLLFKFKCSAICFILWTVNKRCYNDSLCLHEYANMISLERKGHLLRGKKLKWFLVFDRNRHFSKISV